MNSLEVEARKLAEEKGLPLDFVKSMLEFAERTNGEDAAPLTEPPKPHPVPEAAILYWAEMAKMQFEQIMPDLGIPFPSVYTSTTSSYSRTRKKIIKSIGCPHTEEPPDSIMEYIHGEKGNAILIVSSGTSWGIFMLSMQKQTICTAIMHPNWLMNLRYMMLPLMAADTAANGKSRKVTGSGRSL